MVHIYMCNFCTQLLVCQMAPEAKSVLYNCVQVDTITVVKGSQSRQKPSQPNRNSIATETLWRIGAITADPLRM